MFFNRLYYLTQVRQILQEYCKTFAVKMQTICSNNAISTQWLECCILPSWESVRVTWTLLSLRPGYFCQSSPQSHRTRIQNQDVVVELQQFGSNLERYFFRFTGFQENLLKAFQLFHRTGYTSHKVTNIKLNHFCTVSLAGIGHSHGSSQLPLSVMLVLSKDTSL